MRQSETARSMYEHVTMANSDFLKREENPFKVVYNQEIFQSRTKSRCIIILPVCYWFPWMDGSTRKNQHYNQVVIIIITSNIAQKKQYI